MSSLISKNLQVGSDPTATNNFTIFQPATPDGTLRIGNGNTGITSSLLTLTSAGNFGIGTGSPGAKLHVQTSSGYNVYFQTSGSSLRLNYLNDAASANVSAAYRATDYAWQKGDGSDVLKLDSSGNLGLGVTPSAWVTWGSVLQGNGYSISGFNNGSGNVQSFFRTNAYAGSGGEKYYSNGYASGYKQAAGVHEWFTAPSGTAGNAISFTQALTLDASGYLLVGATSTSGAGTGRFQVGDTNSASSILAKSNTAHALIYAASGTDTYFSWNSSGFLAFGQGPTNGSTFTERMRIDSSGNLLVGQTSTSKTNNGVQIYSASGNNGRIDLSKTASGLYSAIANYYNGTYVGGVDYSNSATSFPTSSDVRLKKDIVDAPSASAKIDQIRIVSHGWKHDEAMVEFGVIAQELYPIASQAVNPGDAGEKVEKTWGVDYSKLVPMLIKAHQELKAEFDAYKATHP